MPKDPRHQLFVGIAHSVAALDARDGTELWRTKLGGSSLVNVYWDGEQLFASAKGEVFCLDPRDGSVLWKNPLKGLGLGLATMVTTRQLATQNLVALEETRRRQQAAQEG